MITVRFLRELRRLGMKDRDKWMELCVQAAIESNLETYTYIADQIRKLMSEKEQTLYKEQQARITR
jgi:hypothetical protein